MIRPSMLSLATALLALTACGSTPDDSTPKKSTPEPTMSQPSADANDLYALRANSLDGKPVDLSEFKGRVTLVVNVASECGYTPQYKGLQSLHEKMKARGFAVLGFPSNEFGGQEPGSPDAIRAFCTSKYGVDFPMFAKVATKQGAEQSPVYTALQQGTGSQPNWNFCKYLVGKDGRVKKFYASKVAPDDATLLQDIEAALGS